MRDARTARVLSPHPALRSRPLLRERAVQARIAHFWGKPRAHAAHPQSISRSSRARARAPVRVLTSSFANTFFRCHLAVERAICALADLRIAEASCEKSEDVDLAIRERLEGEGGFAVIRPRRSRTSPGVDVLEFPQKPLGQQAADLPPLDRGLHERREPGRFVEHAAREAATARERQRPIQRIERRDPVARAPATARKQSFQADFAIRVTCFARTITEDLENEAGFFHAVGVRKQRRIRGACALPAFIVRPLHPPLAPVPRGSSPYSRASDQAREVSF